MQTTADRTLRSSLSATGSLLLALLLLLAAALPAQAAREKVRAAGRQVADAGKPRAASVKPAGKSEQAFGFDDVVALAKKNAAEPYKEPASKVPAFLLQGEDAWRVIRFKPEKALWHDEKLPFELQFFHTGSYYNRAVTIHIVDDGKSQLLPFSKDDFDYGGLAHVDEIPSDLGFAGFRVHTHINTSAKMDEFLVFLGASYLRAVGKGEVYGLSARGLAIDTAQPKGEEFPWFSQFWIVKPGPKDKSITIYALLDSPSATGAYRYVATPGLPTVTEVHSVLFLRKAVEKLGIAPLTSMFFFGENSAGRRFNDYRPEIHDSDGLLIDLQSGEWIWRPLQNPRTLQVNTFQAPGIRGFGLMQRDRDFENYQDLDTRQELRPSAWVEPQGEWGPGQIELVQIPTDSDVNDNMVAFWSPAKQPEPGKAAKYDYRIYWGGPFKDIPPEGYVCATRIGRNPDGKSRDFVIEFDGPGLRELPSDAPVSATITVGPGATLYSQKVEKNPANNHWRLTFRIVPDEAAGLNLVLDKRPPVELRAYLKDQSRTLTETWSYAYKL
ncbi:periplasmic glucan biosynthesis protein MdoG [Desulfovibrio sp. X2]|uniref:glucan biosynthesis protein n=1 Tax=Desulfovibrio sp. X2 TaxID=941449 RepID=UPI000358C652|nr:glucan biosynthesis protein G [Desulfovibrio sp. X2]EPR41075.1 periplasmic glucan biosynthesis protein MdoG [Desulfovibrio sp. X2]